MSQEILKLEPKNVWKHFYNLTQIPRPSKKEGRIIEYMKKFGEQLGLETLVDDVGNVIIRKPATKGMEDRKGVILQGHLDMVPQKNSITVHDFENDPIDAWIDGEWVKAKGTTLGSDNGMGVAATMAILESKDLVHGPIEALFTIDEETGMTGAENLKPGLLKGHVLLNLDSEDEGELYIGCAGGVDVSVKFSGKLEKPGNGMIAFKISVTGLKGGHSGLDIHLGKGNACLILNKILLNSYERYGAMLSSIDAGSLRNAIPREAFVTIAIPAAFETQLTSFIHSYELDTRKSLGEIDPDLKITAEKTAIPGTVFDTLTFHNLVNAMAECPNGALAWDKNMPGIVETSSNLAIVKSENENINISILTRSAVDSERDKAASEITAVFKKYNGETRTHGAYPGWKPNINSPILETMKQVYHNKFGKIPEVKVIHAGLECGILGATYTHWDMVSFGPTIRFPHSPDEKVNIATIQKFWDFLVETLKNIPSRD
ncbi:MAG: aminoacyl-histidine dipeptidase [Bacteroidetes bacterium]|nr:aminoacyl-histidine dipeptidase [Bacteroidota bacterium]